jgi:hypothetical protein
MEQYRYAVVTYNGEDEISREYVTLSRSGLNTYDDEVPFSLGSNQLLIELEDGTGND